MPPRPRPTPRLTDCLTDLSRDSIVAIGETPLHFLRRLAREEELVLVEGFHLGIDKLQDWRLKLDFVVDDGKMAARVILYERVLSGTQRAWWVRRTMRADQMMGIYDTCTADLRRPHSEDRT